MAYFAASQILVFMARGVRLPEGGLDAAAVGHGRADAGGGARRARHHAPRSSTGASARGSKPRLERYEKQYVPDLHAPPLDDARKAATRRSDEREEARRARARALRATGRSPRARRCSPRRCALDPKQPDAHYVKVRAGARARRSLDEAARLLEQDDRRRATTATSCG